MVIGSPFPSSMPSVSANRMPAPCAAARTLGRPVAGVFAGVSKPLTVIRIASSELFCCQVPLFFQSNLSLMLQSVRPVASSAVEVVESRSTFVEPTCACVNTAV